jgi:hypothetical protein
MKDYTPILCLDFDGVLHSYSSGWKGPRNIPDPPVDGAMEFLANAVKSFKVCIYSSRSRYWGGRKAMKRWLREHIEDYFDEVDPDLRLVENPFTHDELVNTSRARDFVRDRLSFPLMKPAAFVQLDDRAITFTGTFPDPKELLKFKPWNKREAIT